MDDQLADSEGDLHRRGIAGHGLRRQDAQGVVVRGPMVGTKAAWPGGWFGGFFFAVGWANLKSRHIELFRHGDFVLKIDYRIGIIT